MPIDSTIKMLACVSADGRFVSQCIIEDASAKGAPAPARGSAPLLKKVVVDGLIAGDVVLSPDKSIGKSGVMSSLLSTNSGTDQNRSCDGLILRFRGLPDAATCVVDVGYFDLKSGNPSGYSGQFLSTQCFLKSYALALLKTFYGKPCRIGKERFVILHTDKAGRGPSIRKTPTKAVPVSANSPSNAKKIVVSSGAKIPVSHIIS